MEAEVFVQHTDSKDCWCQPTVEDYRPKRDQLRTLLQKYFDKYNPYDGEDEQTLDAIEALYGR